VDLKFFGTSRLSFLVGEDVKTKRYQPSAAYDVDPLLATVAMPGFTEWAAFYGSYRVNASKITTKFSQNRDYPITAVVLPLNADPGATPTFGTVASWVSNSYAVHNLIAPLGGPVVTLSRTMSTEKIFGTKAVFFDDNFSALVNAVPANNWYWGIGAIISPVPTTTVDVNLMIDINVSVEFFNRKIQLS
jgi:hypothetical protein